VPRVNLAGKSTIDACPQPRANSPQALAAAAVTTWWVDLLGSGPDL